MKTFTSFWLLCSPVKGNFILMCVDGKSVKVIAAYQKPHEVWDTASLALQLIKSSAVRWLFSLCAGEHRDLWAVTTLTAASPHCLPLALWEVPKKPHSTRKLKMSTKTHFCFPWWDTCDGRKADQLVCWVLSRPLPLQDMKLIFFKPAFHYQSLHTHQYLQKHIPANNSERWKMNQRTRNMSNRNSYSCITPEKVLRYGEQKRHLNTYKQSAKADVHGVWPAETTGGGYKGMLEALPAEAGAMISHFSGRCHLRELLLELLSQMWKPSPTHRLPKLWTAFQKHTVFIN